MPRFIVKLAPEAYCEWSTVVDAPTTWLYTRAEMLDYLNGTTFPFGESSRKSNEERLARCDARGTSLLNGQRYPQPFDPADFVRGNRAGKKEETLTLEQILDQYKIPEEK